MLKIWIVFFLVLGFTAKSYAQNTFQMRTIFGGPSFSIGSESPDGLYANGFSREFRLDLGTSYDSALSLGVSVGRISTDYKLKKKDSSNENYESYYNYFAGWFAYNFKTSYDFSIEPAMRINYGSFHFFQENESEKQVPSFAVALELNFKISLGPGSFFFGPGVRRILPKEFEYQDSEFSYTDFEPEIYHMVGVGFAF